jgi:hypothetical protein
MAYNSKTPALIDPPGPYAPLEEWINYRDELARSDLPGLAPFIREANANIGRGCGAAINSPPPRRAGRPGGPWRALDLRNPCSPGAGPSLTPGKRKREGVKATSFG